MNAYIPALIFGAIIGYLIYRSASARSERFGRAPWGWPVALWTVLGFLFGLIAAIVYWIATSRQDKKSSVASTR